MRIEPETVSDRPPFCAYVDGRGLWTWQNTRRTSPRMLCRPSRLPPGPVSPAGRRPRPRSRCRSTLCLSKKRRGGALRRMKRLNSTRGEEPFLGVYHSLRKKYSVFCRKARPRRGQKGPRRCTGPLARPFFFTQTLAIPALFLYNIKIGVIIIKLSLSCGTPAMSTPFRSGSKVLFASFSFKKKKGKNHPRECSH